MKFPNSRKGWENMDDIPKFEGGKKSFNKSLLEKKSQIQGRIFFYKNLSWKKKRGHPTHHPAFHQVHQPTHQSSNPPGLVIPVFFKITRSAFPPVQPPSESTNTHRIYYQNYYPLGLLATKCNPNSNERYTQTQPRSAD